MVESSDQADAAPGQALGHFRMVVEAGKVVEFARAVGDNHAEYSPGVLAPLTFAATATFWSSTDVLAQLGIDTERALHGEEEFRYERPLRAGMELTGEIRLIKQDERQGRRAGTIRRFVVETRFTDAENRLIMVQRRTIVETSTALDAQQ